MRRALLMNQWNRWWVMMAVGVLALSLTSCSKITRRGMNYGWVSCQGTMGVFNVYTIPTGTGMYELSIIPVQVQDSDFVTITLANSNLGYKVQVPDTDVFTNQEVSAGYITEAELNKYNFVTITTVNTQGSYLQQSPEKSTICCLPVPGDNGQCGTAASLQGTSPNFR